VHTSELKNQLAQLSKRYLKRSVELGHYMPLWPWTDRSQSRPVTAPSEIHRMRWEHLENANQQVAESERIVVGWSDLIDRMQADGQDVAMARNLLKSFKDNLEVHRANRDLIPADGRE
jgi:hypothetical protein